MVYLGVQSLIALVAIGLLAYLIAVGKPVPGDLSAIVGAIMGLYFRTVQGAVTTVQNGRAVPHG